MRSMNWIRKTVQQRKAVFAEAFGWSEEIIKKFEIGYNPHEDSVVSVSARQRRSAMRIWWNAVSPICLDHG